MTQSDLPFLSATDLQAGLQSREVSAREAVEASLARIAATDGALRAFITVAAERALDQADALDACSETVGALHGMPIGIKDLTPTEGIATTLGSALHVPEEPVADDPLVERLRRAGAIVIGKTTAPDFGFGSICTSSLRGATRTPYDTRLAAEGSSGGSAAAVAAHQVPLATGGDFGGSLRTPASFCGIVSIRPTPGVIPDPGRRQAWSNLMTDGPMARSVADADLFLQAMSGWDAADPLSRGTPAPRSRHPSPPRICSSEDLGVASVSSEVRGLFRQALAGVEAALGRIETGHPDCSGAIESFMTIRAGLIHSSSRHLLERHGPALPYGVRWNIEAGAGLSADAYLAAEAHRGELYRRFIRFFETCDLLLLPAVALMPFPAETTDIGSIDGQALDSIVHYYAITFITSLIGCPVVTLPAIWSEAGLPLGIQVVGRPHDDAFVIEAARMLEQRLGWTHRADRLTI
jgi:amidase